MNRQNCYRVPYTYDQCMADCTSGDNPGYDYECKVPCNAYKTRPWYIQCPTPMAHTPSAPYGRSQTVPWGYTYEQCMEDCTSGDNPGYDYECKPICNKYPKQNPMYTPYTHTAPYGVSRINQTCYNSCVRLGNSPWVCEQVCREHHR